MYVRLMPGCTKVWPKNVPRSVSQTLVHKITSVQPAAIFYSGMHIPFIGKKVRVGFYILLCVIS